jgi:hypothetical protein
MGRYFDCTLYATAEEPQALDAAVADGEDAAAKQAIRGGQPPRSGPPIDDWSSGRVGSHNWYVAFTVIDMDASTWTAELAARNPDVRFDLIQVEGVDIPYPEGVRFIGPQQLTGVPLFVPGSSPEWALVEEGISEFNPDDPEFIDGTWELLDAPPPGLLPGDADLDGSDADREIMRELAGGLRADLNLVRTAFESAETATVERSDSAFVLALLSPENSVGRPEVYVGFDGIAAEWQPTNEDLAAAVARLLLVGALESAGMEAPMPM